LQQLEVLRRGALGLALRNQEIAGVALPDLDHFAEVADVVDFFEQYDLHASLALVQVGLGQEREKARPLDRGRQLPLVACLGAGDARRHDLAVFLHEVLQDVDVLVIDLLDALGGEAAELLALEQVIPALALLAILAFTFAFGVSSHGTGHLVFLWFRSVSALAETQAVSSNSLTCSATVMPVR